MPNEKPPTRRRAAWVRPTWDRTWSARVEGQPGGGGDDPQVVAGAAAGMEAGGLQQRADVADGIGSSRYGLPSIRADPAVGVTTPNSIRRVVVLPAPLGPRNPTTVPWSTSKLRSSTASTSPKRLVSPSMVIAAMASSSAPAGLLIEADHLEGAEHLDGTKRGRRVVAPSRHLRVSRQIYAEDTGQLTACCSWP